MHKKAKTTLNFRWMLAVLCLIMFTPPLAAAGPYTESAHGNSTTYGVLRTAGTVPMPASYVRGNCAHCHEQHASVGGDEPTPNNNGPSGSLLLAEGFDSSTTGQAKSACFQCHGTPSLQSGGVTNNNYAATFGGESPPTASTIMAAFNLASYHNLSGIQSYLGNFTGLTTANNPCSGCHNVHIAKANWQTPGDPTQTAISRPSVHEDLWGDDATETMKSHAEPTGVYRAPFYVGATTTSATTKHEPSGDSGDINSAAVQGSTTPDYNTYCLDCHQNPIWGSRYIRPINFGTSGDRHGLAAAGLAGNQGHRLAPYTFDGTIYTGYDYNTNFVLSCLDCHEPHGSNNFDLLRSTVNGKTGLVAGTTGKAFCAGCHDSAGHQSVATCVNCHYHSSGRF